VIFEADIHLESAPAELTTQEVPAFLKEPGVEADDLLSEAGRKVLAYHFNQMLLHEEGTRLGQDIEELHDMRVATRRMRAAFEVFADAYKKKTLKKLLKDLRLTGRTLGRVRDLDVFIEKAQHYAERLPEEKRLDLEPLLSSWGEERESAREEMVEYLDGSKYEAFKQEYWEFLRTPYAGARQLPQDALAPRRVREIAPVLIYSRLAAVRAFDSILEDASIEQFHALRIEFKKLRYTVEFFREVLGEEAKSVINDFKTIQDHLGDLNDAQVATQILRDYLTKWDEQQSKLPVSQRKSPEAVLAYLLYNYLERERLMKTFQEKWKRFNQPEFQHRLALAVSAL
jgi:CHAD domain-containing protein